MVMTHRKRMQLIAALIIAPVVIALPMLWPRIGEPGFLRSYLDVLLIFVVLPYCAALWLYLSGERPR